MAVTPRESRKVVTVLFTDVAEWTQLAERLDPEPLRRLISRYFEEMRTVIERHGGTIEKFIGDEVMAVFGVPQAHEDDALRAVRAASEMREQLSELNDELERRQGVRINARTGINTGPVVAGDPGTGHTFVTGDPVNVAKRLEQAARPAEVLIGESTLALVRNAVVVEPTGPLALKGKAVAMGAWRLLAVSPEAPPLARRLDTPMVGRTAELALLKETFERTASDRTPHLITILGPAGIGKSRLSSELFGAVRERATILIGRCLPYGDGITFWPLVEILRRARQAQPAGEAEQAAGRVEAAISGAGPSGAQEIFWAVRKLFEALARERPLVVCFEDIHWAEPTLLDLIEYLGWSEAAPILFVCLARAELLDRQPAWTTPKENTTVLPLSPLSDRETDSLLEVLRGDTDLDEKARARIAAAAEGNPLFVEQFLAMLVEAGDEDRVSIPPSIHALLTARLDRLGPEERALIERAAVAGREFWRSAVLSLSAQEARSSVDAHLMGLVRKGFFRPDPSRIERADDAFRFAHALVRDAAYEGIAKEQRAELHEAFAGWLEREASEGPAELEEIVGYHLEQAHNALAALGPKTARAEILAHRAAERLAAAGRRAAARGDMPAAAALLTRATVLMKDDETAQLELAPALGMALADAGELDRADAVLTRAIEGPAAAIDIRLRAHAVIAMHTVFVNFDPRHSPDEVVREAEQAMTIFANAGDELGLAEAWKLRAMADFIRCRFARAADAFERALEHAVKAGDPRQRASAMNGLAAALAWGPTPVAEAIRRSEAILQEGEDDRTVQAITMGTLSRLEAMRGDFERAHALCTEAVEQLEDLGARRWLAIIRRDRAAVHMLANDPAAARRELIGLYPEVERMADNELLAAIAVDLADAEYALGRYAEAGRYSRIAEQAAAAHDRWAQVLWRTTQAKLEARSARVHRAENLAREAVSLAAATDDLSTHAKALLGLAEVLELADRPAESSGALEEALALFERKGDRVSSSLAQAALAGPAPR